jgi:uncharacterized protein YyaL (SSP411 family)
MLTKTLTSMAKGGIFDQLGGGFHRYSTDRFWLVPHFEKMLYANALLTSIYVDAWLITRNPFYRRVAEQTINCILTEMASPLEASTQRKMLKPRAKKATIILGPRGNR